MRCFLCPRRCGADRRSGATGYCGETETLRLAAASIHRGEEPPITGAGGSGTIFVTGCNLGCEFCQNRQISQQGMGGAVTREEFARICLDLQDRGAENINIVTGSHAVSALAEGLIHARALGLKMPVLWNSSGYDSLDALALLEDLVDGYLPDLKTLDAAVAGRFFNAPDYPEHAAQAVLRMIETRRLRFSGDSLASGVIVRHLVLPGYLASTKAVLQWFADRCRGKALLSLMMQYTPVGNTALTRTVSEREYEQVLQWLEDFGIEDGYYQELHPGDDWLPDFSRLNPFSSDLSVPVWHWEKRGKRGKRGKQEKTAAEAENS